MSEQAEWKSALSKSERQAVVQLEIEGAVIKPFDVEQFEFHGLVVRFDNDQLTATGLISDKAAAALAVLPQALLELRQTTLNKNDLAKIYRLTNLKGLDLAATSAADTVDQDRERERPKPAETKTARSRKTVISVQSIAKMKSLIMLDLADNRVTDSDVAELRKLKELRSFSLINTSISDVCVNDLQKLERLRELYLTRTRLSANAIKLLREKLPRCVIEA